MILELKKLQIQNFKGTSNLSVEFGKHVIISGQNGSGKTSIADAFMWLLFGKNLAGESDFAVRPNRKDGARIDNLVIQAFAVLEVDGQEVTLTKTQEQNWVKKRGGEVAELQGNVNKYEIDDIPKTERDYLAYINSLVVEKLFKLITNSGAFTSLKWKEQREILLELVSGVTDKDVILLDEKFGVLEKLLERASVDDLTAKAKKALKELKKTQAELPARIDEANHAIVVVDLAEQEQKKVTLTAQIANVEQQLDDASKAGEAIAAMQEEIQKIQLEMGRVADRENESIVSLRREAKIRKCDADSAFAMAMQRHSNAERDKEESGKLLEAAKRNREQLLIRYGEANEMELDASSLTCPMCGQALPEAQREVQMDEFAKKKKAAIADIVEKGKKAAADILCEEGRVKELESLIEVYKAEKVKQNGLSASAAAELEELPESVDLSGCKEYQDLSSKLDGLKKRLSESDTSGGYRSQLRDKRAGLQLELDAVNKALSSQEANERARARVKDLEVEQRDVAKKVAKQEQGLFLLEEFTKAKMELLSSKINSKFKLVNFKLFENQINGGYKETCECMIDGIGFAGLSNGQRMMAGLDIISTLQDMFGVNAVVFVDNTESINDFNIPKMNCQTVLLKVTDEPKIGIKGGTFNE